MERRLSRLYADIVIDDEEYARTKDLLQAQLAALVPPDVPQIIAAGEMLAGLGPLWEAATRAERRDISRLLLRRALVDIGAGRIVRIEPQPAFRFLLAEACEELEVEVG